MKLLDIINKVGKDNVDIINWTGKELTQLEDYIYAHIDGTDAQITADAIVRAVKQLRDDMINIYSINI